MPGCRRGQAQGWKGNRSEETDGQDEKGAEGLLKDSDAVEANSGGEVSGGELLLKLSVFESAEPGRDEDDVSDEEMREQDGHKRLLYGVHGEGSWCEVVDGHTVVMVGGGRRDWIHHGGTKENCLLDIDWRAADNFVARQARPRADWLGVLVTRSESFFLNPN